MKEEKKKVNGKALDNNSLEKVVGGSNDIEDMIKVTTIDDVDYTDTTDVTDDMKRRI